MNAAYFHLVVNHFPIILSIMGVLAALLALIVKRRGAWLYAAASLTIAGLLAYPVMLTGHAAEDVMRDKWYVTKESIDEHEEAADLATWVLLGAGLINAFAWWRIARAGRDASGAQMLPGGVIQTLVLVTGLAGAGTVSYAALQGGKIVHNAPALETAPPGAAPSTTPTPPGATTPPSTTTPSPIPAPPPSTAHDSGHTHF